MGRLVHQNDVLNNIILRLVYVWSQHMPELIPNACLMYFEDKICLLFITRTERLLQVEKPVWKVFILISTRPGVTYVSQQAQTRTRYGLNI